MTTRTTCPHCGRSIAVIGNHGKLARHHCVDNPATMRPAERVRVTRELESRARKALLDVQSDRIHCQRWRHRWNVMAWVTTAVFVFAVVTLVFHFNDLAVIGAVTSLIGVMSSRSRLAYYADRVDRRGASIAQAETAHAAALATLTELEAALPADVVWPELHARPTDLDNLES